MVPLVDNLKTGLPKQFPLKGMNILQAVAMGNSAETMVFMMTSSILNIIAAKAIKISYGFDIDLFWTWSETLEIIRLNQ